MQGQSGIECGWRVSESTQEVVEFKVRWLALPPPFLLHSLDGCAALESKVRDGEVRRSHVAFEKGVEIPAELHFER